MSDRSRRLEDFELTPPQEKAYALLGLITVGELVDLDPKKLSDRVRALSRELLESMGLHFGAPPAPPAEAPPPPPVKSALELALFAALEAASTSAFTAAVKRAGWSLTARDREAVLGLSAISVGQAGRGHPDGLALILAVLARWPALTARDRPSQADDFLRNALGTVGAARPTLKRLAKRAAHSQAPLVLFNLACAWALMGDVPRVVAALKRAFAVGIRPAQVEHDDDFAQVRARPELVQLLAEHTLTAEPFEIASHRAAVEALLVEIRALCAKHKLKLHLPPPASVERIRRAEARAGRGFPNEYRALLALHDGIHFDDVKILGTADFLEASPLYASAREFIEEMASYGTAELLECVPLANLGQPNHWLLHDARRTEGPFVTWLTADDFASPSLCKKLVEEVRLIDEVNDDQKD